MWRWSLIMVPVALSAVMLAPWVFATDDAAADTSRGAQAPGLFRWCVFATDHAAAETETPRKSPGGPSLLTVFDFGAVGDGVADDTAAVQRAVDSGRGDILFPRGVYRITRPIEIQLDESAPIGMMGTGTAKVVMAGPGPAFRFRGTHFGTAAPRTVQPGVWEWERTFMVDGLEIVGEHEEAVGIEASGTMQLTLTRLTIRRTLHAVHLVERNRNVIVANCHFYENRGVGLFLDDVDLHQINVGNCHISYNGGGGIVSLAGNVRNLHVSGCDIESNMAEDGPPTANILIDSRGGKHGTAEVAITGCTIQHNHTGPDSANIRIIGSDERDRRWGHVTIASNVLSDVQVNIDLLHARGVTIVGNTFWMGFSYDLRAVDCSNLVLSANNFDRNPHYAYGVALEAKGGILLESCRDSTVTGLHLNGVHTHPAAVMIHGGSRLNIAQCTILDSEHAGMIAENVTDSRISGCMIRNDAEGPGPWTALIVRGGEGNHLSDNVLGPDRE